MTSIDSKFERMIKCLIILKSSLDYLLGTRW